MRFWGGPGPPYRPLLNSDNANQPAMSLMVLGPDARGPAADAHDAGPDVRGPAADPT